MNPAATAPPPVGPLRPIELATGAVLGGVTIALSVVSSYVPLAAALQILAVIPMGVVAQRHRPRAFLTTTIAVLSVSFVAGGVPTVLGVLSCAILGGITGSVKRRGRGLGSVICYALVAGLASAAASVAILFALAPTRQLMFDALRNTATGLAKLLERAAVLVPVADWIGRSVDMLLRWWWLWLGGSMVLSVLTGAVVSWFVLGAVLDRLAALPAEDRLDTPDDNRAVAPLPVRLHDVSYRYPGAGIDTLSGIDLTVDVGEFVAVVGHNGSGKSTLTRILAGRQPTGGTVTRPGAAGLGRFEGTAVVLQRPESQILGVLVADDIVWGLPEGAQTDIDGLLAEVGLAGMGARETSSLSGGQQQRLAVAAALARRPKLLIADEATAMVDPDGRRELVALLAELPRRRQMAVVLVTHQEAEAAAADRVVHLVSGRSVAQLPAWPKAAPVAITRRAGSSPLLRLHGVRHTYLARTPWAAEALYGVDLTVDKGDGVLIVGGNGSGKSTLAWIIAGLIEPSTGSCELDGKPMIDQVGRVGLAFQHSRLQLLRRTVGDEIASWGGASAGSAGVGRALDAVGLDRALAARSIEELSGGQARRVALAGLLARRPRLVVLDEPLAGLDPLARRDIVELLASLRASGLTLVVISHDVDGMSAICNRTVRLESGRIGTDEHGARMSGLR